MRNSIAFLNITYTNSYAFSLGSSARGFIEVINSFFILNLIVWLILIRILLISLIDPSVLFFIIILGF